MPIVLFGMRFLEVLFFIGIAGSAIVVVMATWEDIQEISPKTEHGHTVEKTPAT
jgi:cell division protein FtsL